MNKKSPKIQYFGQERIEAQHNLEKNILGQILIENESVYRVAGELSENLFTVPENRIVVRAVLNLLQKDVKIDLITLTNEIVSLKLLQQVGGIPFISNLTNHIATTQNLEVHFKILQQNFIARNLIELGEEVKGKIIEGIEDVFEVRDEAVQAMEAIEKNMVKSKISSVSEIHAELLKETILHSNSKTTSGVPSGLKLVDSVTNGWQKSDLIILAGRPAMGKTACAVSMVMNPALEENIPVGIFSLEMSKEQVVGRMQSILSKINVSKIVKKQLDGNEIIALDKACKALETAPIYIDDTAAISIIEFKSKARTLVRDFGVQMIVVDYLQLMRSGLRNNNREQEISEISRGLKSVAKELSIPIIALSQLSRSVEMRGGDKKPQLSDLRESGQIEQDADMVIFCYRPEYYDIPEYEINDIPRPTDGLFLLLIAKHRNGSLGDMPLRFIHENTYITNHSDFLPRTNNEESNQQYTQGSSKLQPNRDFDHLSPTYENDEFDTGGTTFDNEDLF
jgi:replicative DNA helicase